MDERMERFLNGTEFGYYSREFKKDELRLIDTQSANLHMKESLESKAVLVVRLRDDDMEYTFWFDNEDKAKVMASAVVLFLM